MTKWVVAYRKSYEPESWTFYLGADDLRIAVAESEAGAIFYPRTQFAVFRNQAPRGWYATKRHYTHGPSDAELYERTYGVPMPVSSALGGVINSYESDFAPRGSK